MTSLLNSKFQIKLLPKTPKKENWKSISRSMNLVKLSIWHSLTRYKYQFETNDKTGDFETARKEKKKKTRKRDRTFLDQTQKHRKLNQIRQMRYKVKELLNSSQQLTE